MERILELLSEVLAFLASGSGSAIPGILPTGLCSLGSDTVPHAGSKTEMTIEGSQALLLPLSKALDAILTNSPRCQVQHQSI